MDEKTVCGCETCWVNEGHQIHKSCHKFVKPYICKQWTFSHLFFFFHFYFSLWIHAFICVFMSLDKWQSVGLGVYCGDPDVISSDMSQSAKPRPDKTERDGKVGPCIFGLFIEDT